MVENFKFDKDNITGKCPECNFDWDKGDAFECVKGENEEIKINFPTDIYPHVGAVATDEQLQKRAFKRYGWTLENRVHLSHLTHLMLSDGDLDNVDDFTHYQCPKCLIAWNITSGERTDRFKVLLDQHESMVRAMTGMNNRNDGE
jgi:hypothetical protein